MRDDRTDRAQKRHREGRRPGAWVRDNLEVITFAIVMALGLKVFAVEAYQIPTGSMQPTLLGTDLAGAPAGAPGEIHDRVLVDKLSYLLRDPKRWEVVVFRYPLATLNNYVKRCVGLPGEELRIEHGDLYARPLGSTEPFAILRKPESVQDSLWKKVSPEPSVPVDGQWPGWTVSHGAIDAQGTLRFGAGTRTRFSRIRNAYHHGYPDPLWYWYRLRPPGHARSNQPVGDLRLACTATPSGEGESLEFDLMLGAYRLQLGLSTRSRLQRIRLPDGSTRALEMDLRPESPVEVDLAYWDHTVRVRLRTETQTEQFGPLPLDLASRPVGSSSVDIEAAGGGWRVGLPTLWRDLHYLPARSSALRNETFEVLPEHYFMMGDNTHLSLDSRGWEGRRIRTAEPVRGRTEFWGDDLVNGHDPVFDNPRENQAGDWTTFRDEHGELFGFPSTAIASEVTEPVHLVPRNYILGKVMAMFLPVPPLSPVARFGLVR